MVFVVMYVLHEVITHSSSEIFLKKPYALAGSIKLPLGANPTTCEFTATTPA
jgi:hypothetical protein